MKDIFGNPNGGNNKPNMPEFKISTPILVIGIIVLALIIGFSRSFKIIDAKERGIVRNLGKLSPKILEPGVQIEIPFVSVISTIDISTKKLSLDGIKIYTKDQQSATLSAVANYNIRPDKVIALYKKLGTLNKDLFEQTIIFPILQSSIRNEIGKWTAEQVITEKERIASRIFANLRESESSTGLADIIAFSNFEIISLNLDESYEAAVRAKVIAEQQAKTAENKTKQIQEEARQKIIKAEAEAKSLKIRSAALGANKSLIEYEAVQKWDGALPQYMMGDTTPFINIDPAKAKK
jgi:prohibitin 2